MPITSPEWEDGGEWNWRWCTPAIVEAVHHGDSAINPSGFIVHYNRWLSAPCADAQYQN